MVGSSNIDPFSLLLAREANLQIQHADFAQSLRRHMLNKIQRHARQVAPQEPITSLPPKRALVWLCYGLVRAGIQVSGYGGVLSGSEKLACVVKSGQMANRP